MNADVESAAGKSKRTWRWGRGVLIASLALNLALIGGLVSAFVRHGGPYAALMQPGQTNLAAFAQTLPKDRGQAIWRSTAEKRRVMAPLRQQVRQARRDALAALTADPFDHEVFRAAQTKLIEAESRVRLAMRDVLVDIAGSMTNEERRAYIRWRGPPRPAVLEDDEPGQKK